MRDWTLEATPINVEQECFIFGLLFMMVLVGRPSFRQDNPLQDMLRTLKRQSNFSPEHNHQASSHMMTIVALRPKNEKKTTYELNETDKSKVFFYKTDKSDAK